MKANPNAIVREIVLENPWAARLFEGHGIDYCCGGTRRLAEACRNANVPVDSVIAELEATALGEETADRQWASATLTELADHIVEKHHAFVRKESPRLTELLQKVRTRHIGAHPELNRIAELFDALTSELALHMLKEERVLFPMIKQMENAPQGPGQTHRCSIEFPIRQMVAEHEDAGEVLVGIRSLTSGFQPPDDACPSFRALYQGLQDFESDLHEHIHLENNILFPRTMKMAAQEVGGVSG